jgi:catechol 2,3-dioxygenase-like lactoylglutathione lyase family enzyme
MTHLRLAAVAFDVPDPASAAEFWAAMLHREVHHRAGSVLLPGSVTQVGLRFAASDAGKAGQSPLHLHLTSDDAEDQRRIVDQALTLGASHLDVGQKPEEGHVVLADPAGNEFCVIEPHNDYLAGCGPLGEVACDGTREVGLFWAEALDWPLVWEHEQETAVQSPAGGTKVAWGGPPLLPRHGRNRQRFDLELVDATLADELERLIGLGARVLHREGGGAVALADPDGNEFQILPG